MVGCSVGRLVFSVGRSVGQCLPVGLSVFLNFVCWSVGLFVCWLVGWMVGCFLGWLVGWFVAVLFCLSCLLVYDGNIALLL